jgi:hypothetical protein
MRTATFLLLSICLFISGCNQQTESTEAGQTVNAVIGDISFVEKFGSQPAGLISEQTRIETHLEYVEQLLRQKDVSHLPAELQENRLKMLDLLNEYLTAGEFPRNYDYPGERKPCFIDKNESICAVGYLVEKTAGLDIAKKINSLFQYSYVTEMNLPALSDWVANSGLTLKECAMIQPAYGDEDVRDPISLQYGLGTSVLTGTNLALSAANTAQISSGTDKIALPTVALFTGFIQVALGAFELQGERLDEFNEPVNPQKRTLAMFNIGMGTSTLILSGCNLLINNKKKEGQDTSLNLFSFPANRTEVGLGLTFTRQF